MALCLLLAAGAVGCRTDPDGPGFPDAEEEQQYDGGGSPSGADAGSIEDGGSIADAGIVPEPDFAVRLPSLVTVRAGGSATLPVEIHREAGFDGAIELRVAGLPQGVQASVVTVEPEASSADIPIEADGQTVTGQPFAVTVEGSGAGLLRTADCNLLVLGRPGTLDVSFDGDGILSLDLGADAFAGEAIALRPDGRILIAARNAVSKELSLVQLLPDGSLDGSFGAGGKAKLPEPANGVCALELLEDGSALVLAARAAGEVGLSRVSAAGVVDAAYQAGALFGGTCRRGALLSLPGGRVLAAGAEGKLLHLSMRDALTGAAVQGFGDGGVKSHDLGTPFYGGSLLADGSGVLHVGSLWMSGGLRPVIIRLDLDGYLYPGFGQGGFAWLGGGSVYGLDVQRGSDGTLMAFSLDGAFGRSLAELRMSGGEVPDPAPVVVEISDFLAGDALARPDGSFDVAGYSKQLDRCVVVHLDAYGSLDVQFGQGGKVELSPTSKTMCFGVARDELGLWVVGMTGSPSADVLVARVWL